MRYNIICRLKTTRWSENVWGLSPKDGRVGLHPMLLVCVCVSVSITLTHVSLLLARHRYIHEKGKLMKSSDMFNSSTRNGHTKKGRAQQKWPGAAFLLHVACCAICSSHWEQFKHSEKDTMWTQCLNTSSLHGWDYSRLKTHQILPEVQHGSLWSTLTVILLGTCYDDVIDDFASRKVRL